MCNLYSQTKSQDAMRHVFDVMIEEGESFEDLVGNLPPMAGIWPDYAAPIIRQGTQGIWQLTKARWGMPTPQTFLNGKRTDPGVTNIRNTASPHWKRWLGVENRCLVPFTSFSEIDSRPGAPRNASGLVHSWPRSPLGLLRGHPHRMDFGAQAERGRGDGGTVRLSDLPAQCGSGPHPPKGDARDFDAAGGMAAMVDGPRNRGTAIAAPIGGWGVADRGRRGAGRCGLNLSRARLSACAPSACMKPMGADAEPLQVSGGASSRPPGLDSVRACAGGADAAQLAAWRGRTAAPVTPDT